MNKYLEQRLKIEKQIINRLVRRQDKVEIYNLPRGINNKILTLSPYTLYNNTNQNCYDRYAYSGLSREIHKMKDERAKIEEQINKIIKLNSTFTHLVLTEELNTYENVFKYCTYHKLPMISKEKFNTLKKLINKWRLASSETHYSLTKDEKRVLKKIYKRTTKSM